MHTNNESIKIDNHAVPVSVLIIVVGILLSAVVMTMGANNGAVYDKFCTLEL